MSSKGYKYIAFNVIDELGKTVTNLTNIKVYKTGTTTNATIYKDADGYARWVLLGLKQIFFIT